ncbi:hypothetical protein [Gordonia crocea]|nr:hypothetical protein [Gordonia crocea]
MATGTKKRSTRVLFTLGVTLFLAGLVSVGILYLVPVVWSGHTAPLPVYLVAMCTPVGLVLAIGATVAAGRTR